MSRTTTLAALAVGAFLLAGCELEDRATGAGGLDPAAADQSQVPSTAEEDAQLLAELRVAPELDDADYDRDDWNHWTSIDGCDTRSRVLQDTALTTAPLDVNDSCTVTAGNWRSTFDGEHPQDAELLTDPSEVDIDHVVPLAEAHRSGGANWDEQHREDYANSTDGFVLAPVAAADNRAKGDADPAEWQPQNRCLYAGFWIEAKYDWDLAIDLAERDALTEMLGTCPDR